MTASLIARLQALTGPDREVDEAIARHLGWTHFWNGMNVYLPPGETETDCPNATNDGFPRYTSSLDAAMTLVPEHSTLDIEFDAGFANSGKRLPFAFIAIQDDRLDHMNPQNPQHIGRHDSSPIALCIAALKARGVVHD